MEGVDKLKGWRTFILASMITLAYWIRIFMLDDAHAAELLTGLNLAAVIAAIGALIGAGKFGDAQLRKAEGPANGQ